MSLLTVVQNAMTECGLPRPSSVFSNTNDTVEQFVALLYKAGRDLIRDYDWQKLIILESLTCASTNAQTGYPVAAFKRMAKQTDVWNATSKWPLSGPVNSEEWRQLITQTAIALPQYWRIVGGVLNVYPPKSGDTLTYEYISRFWIYQAGITQAATLAGDTDTFIFDEDLLELDLIWRWKQSKQLDYAEDMKTWQIALSQEKQDDRGGVRTISTNMHKMERPLKTWQGTVTP